MSNQSLLPQEQSGFRHRWSAVDQDTVWQTCTTYGPPKFFLQPTRAFSILENVAKARPRLNNCRSQNFFHSTTKPPHRNETDRCAIDLCGKCMLIISPFDVSELCRPAVWHRSLTYKLMRLLHVKHMFRMIMEMVGNCCFRKKQERLPKGICHGTSSRQHLHLWPTNHRLQRVCRCWRSNNQGCWWRLAVEGVLSKDMATASEYLQTQGCSANKMEWERSPKN